MHYLDLQPPRASSLSTFLAPRYRHTNCFHFFSLDREGTSSLPPPSACGSLRHWKHCAQFFFCEVPPWGWMQDGYSINQASSRCELCGAKCSPRVQAQTRDIGSRWKEDRGGRRWGRVRGLFSNLVIWSQKQANLFFSFKAGGNCCENLPF